MTVADLIKKLADCDKDKEVFVIDDWGEWMHAGEVSEDENGVYIE